MFKISIDPGHAFDMLSILEVKNKIRKIKNFDCPNYIRLYQEIVVEIGLKKLKDILKSKEYKELLKNNTKVFKMVELAQKDNGLAKAVDDSNYLRYKSKIKLQEKFFKTKASEIKIGY